MRCDHATLTCGRHPWPRCNTPPAGPSPPSAAYQDQRRACRVISERFRHAGIKSCLTIRSGGAAFLTGFPRSTSDDMKQLPRRIRAQPFRMRVCDPERPLGAAGAKIRCADKADVHQSPDSRCVAPPGSARPPHGRALSHRIAVHHPHAKD